MNADQEREAVELLTALTDECPEEFDLGMCGYFARFHNIEGFNPEAECEYGGCVDEPACVTNEPSGGWTSRRARAFLASVSGGTKEEEEA